MEYPKIYEVERIYFLFLAIIAIPVNTVAIVILARRKCGLSECITCYLLAMAAADLAVTMTDVVMHRLNHMYFPVSFLLLTPVCSLRHALFNVSIDCSVWFTVAFTFDRCAAICYSSFKQKYCRRRTVTVILSVIFVGSCLRSIPIFFLYQTVIVIDNIPWYCTGKPNYATSTFWKAYECIESIVNPLLPICMILVFNALTIRHIIATSKVRKALRSTSKNHNDPETEKRRNSMILLFALSANFILLWMVNVVYSMTWQLVNCQYQSKYFDGPIYIVQQVGVMLQLLSSSTNTCIYGLTQKKFRAELKHGIKFLFTLNGNCVKN
ncbi:uncharacterized protein LOC125449487 [Stegostoma tigrinum]|uniref:uncharacterized protein LOC125449487 n=1 Tax=Stegostoma tigrinum TaxID=3053191 RepID=UPI00202AD465|nr:uncharacterized protein LOC125449487 [Stegostoma tigrinum]